jgi:cytochrome c-type biogenesis protein CcmE
MGKKKMKFLIGGLVIFAAIFGLGTYALSNNAVYYYTVSELTDGGPREKVRVSGQLLAGTVEQSQVGGPLIFKIYDKAASGEPMEISQVETYSGPVLDVSFVGTVPDSFKDDPKTEVVIEGDYSANGTFNATYMLAKCPSKYEAAAEEGEDHPGSVATDETSAQ